MAVSSISLQQLAATNELCLSFDTPCWVVESDLNQARVYQQQTRTSLICADEHSMLAFYTKAIQLYTDGLIGQQLLTMMLQSVARGKTAKAYKYSSFANHHS